MTVSIDFRRGPPQVWRVHDWAAQHLANYLPNKKDFLELLSEELRSYYKPGPLASLPPAYVQLLLFNREHRLNINAGGMRVQEEPLGEWLKNQHPDWYAVYNINYEYYYFMLEQSRQARNNAQRIKNISSMVKEYPWVEKYFEDKIQLNGRDYRQYERVGNEETDAKMVDILSWIGLNCRLSFKLTSAFVVIQKEL